MTGTDQINVAGKNKSKKDEITGMKRELSDLKQSWSQTRFDEELSRDETFLDEYLDNKIIYTTQMTNRIQSALRSLDDHINSTPHIISENNSNEEK